MIIKSISETGEFNERKFDNRRVKFFTIDDEPINISISNFKLPSEQKNKSLSEEDRNVENIKREIEKKSPEKYFNQVSSTKKNRNIKEIKIQLGLICNFKCKYCKQSIHTDNAAISTLKDVENFIENFDTWCTSPKEDPMKIQLWGGEPLLYINEIKLLVNFFKTRFDHLDVGLVSNGSLMNEEIANFLLENNIGLSISYDGPWQLENRTGNPLKEGSGSLKWIKYYADNSKHGVYFNAVLTKNNIDPKAAYDSVKDIMGENFSFGFEGITAIEDEDQCSEKYLFSDEDYDRLKNIIKEQISSGALNNVSPFPQKIMKLMSALSSQKYFIYDNTFLKCGMDNEHILAVNLKGEALICHSTVFPIGHVDDFDNIDMTKGQYTHWNEREECKNCPVLSLCKGACPTLTGNEWYHTCNNEFNWNMAVFEAVFEFIFKEKILSIEGVVRPERNDK